MRKPQTSLYAVRQRFGRLMIVTLAVGFLCLVGLLGIVLYSQLYTMLKVKRLSQRATLPTRGSDMAAGYDLASARDMVVPARGRAVVETDVAVAVPKGCYGRVAPRSGLAVNHSVDTAAGVVDADYRGSVAVVLVNNGGCDFQVRCGDRIAQLIIERIANLEIVEVKELDSTGRGSGGFGSTGTGPT